DYLLAGHNRYFTPALAEADVLGSFVGLRPLIRSRSDRPSAISREFQMFASPSGLLSVAGGKYTTYRRMAEVITDTIASRLGRRRVSRTRRFPLDGAPRVPWQEFQRSEVATLCQRHGMAEEAARHLVGRYGRRAADVAAYLEHNPSLAQPV